MATSKSKKSAGKSRSAGKSAGRSASKSAGKSAARSGPLPPYGSPIREAMARGDVQEMRRVAASARKWMSDVQSALTQLEQRMSKLGGGR